MILIKAGGSAITDKRSPFSIKEDAISTLARELSGSREKIVICHGGGSFGHPLALKYNLVGDIASEEQMRGVSKVNIAMRKLSNILADSLSKEGCNPFVLQSSAIMTAKGGVMDNFDHELIRNIAGCGFIPILYGDVVYDSIHSFCIVSGDQIMRRLAENFPGSRAIFLTDVEGIYSSDPKIDKSAELIGEITFDELKEIDAGTTGDITGGMKGKIEEIMLFRGHIDEIIVTSLEKKGSLSSALKGKNPGTRIIR